MANTAQRSFAGGEIAPALYARTDQTKYATGLRTVRNFIVQRHGGVANRPGTAYVAEVKDSSDVARLLKFVYNDAQTYVIEAGDRYFRFHQDGAPVVTSGVSAWVTATDYALADLVTSGGTTYYAITAHTSGAASEPGVGASWQTDWYALDSGIYEIPTPYLAADLAAIQSVQSTDVMTLVHPSYAPMELKRFGHTDWTLEEVAIGPGVAAPTNVNATGGVAGADTWYAVTAVTDSDDEESLAGTKQVVAFVPDAATPIVVTWDAVTGAAEYNIFRSSDGSTYGYIGTAGGSPSTVTHTVWVTSSSSVNSVGYDTWTAAATQVRMDVVATAADKSYDGRYRLSGTIDFLTSGTASSDAQTSGRVRAYYKRNTDAVRVDAGIIAEAIMSGDGGTTGTFTRKVVTVPDDGYTTLQLDFVPEVSLSGGSGGAAMTLTGTSVDASLILREFSDNNITPDYTQSPPVQRSLFASVNEYPAAVGYYQQRRLFANTNTQPETTWASQTARPSNFSTMFPTEDDGTIQWTLQGRQVNAVRHLIDLGTLISFTSGGAYTIEGDAAGILRPADVNPRRVSSYGAGTLSPIEVADSALFVQARGTKVRDLRPDAISGDGYQGNDLTIFAAHLFDGYTIVDWDFAEEPNSIVWAVRSDGTLLGLTYLRDQAVWGWHRHDTDGVVERITIVPEGAEDRIYLVVRRTINGTDHRYIERMASRYVDDITTALFMDCALSYDGVAADTFTGLDHLEGKAVAVLADGFVIASPNDPDLTRITVTGGSITLPAEYSVVHVGLPYLSDLETLDIDTASGPSLKQTNMNVQSVRVMLEASRGLWAGMDAPSDDTVDATEGLDEPKMRELENYEDPIALLTGDVEVTFDSTWNSHGRVFLRQIDPLPLTILAVMPQGYLTPTG